MDIGPDSATCLECPWTFPFKNLYKGPSAGHSIRIHTLDEVKESVDKVVASQVILSIEEV